MRTCAGGSRLLQFACVMALVAGVAAAQDAPGSMSAGPMPHAKPAATTAASDQAPASAASVIPPPPASSYDKAIFQKPMAPAEMDFMKQFAGKPSGALMKDKQFRKLLKDVVPDCSYRYGRDMPLRDALDMAIETSAIPVQVRDGRFVLVSGLKGAYLAGRAFLWFDMQDGLGAGGFFFHPTNGEPTPVLNVFARQIREDAIGLSQLPPDFAADMGHWSAASGVPPVVQRYFLTGANKKIVLEHDEDYCLAWDGSRMGPDSGCEQMAADAADMDLTGAYFTDATHHVTNATAYMLDQDQVAFIGVRDQTCRIGPDPLGCRIRMTRERTQIIIRGGPRPMPRPGVRR
jgi:uncharacterized protein YecT (DUF1311 family)